MKLDDKLSKFNKQSKIAKVGKYIYYSIKVQVVSWRLFTDTCNLKKKFNTICFTQFMNFQSETYFKRFFLLGVQFKFEGLDIYI